MERQAGILQQRIEAFAVKRRRHQAIERIRRQDHKEQKANGNHGLDRERPRLQPGWQVAPETSDNCTEQSQDQDPEQHRSFVITPDTADLVDHRFQRIRILCNILHAEVTGHVGIGQRQEREGEQTQLCCGRRACDRHPGAVIAGRTDHRHDGLCDGDAECEDHREMANFYDHFL